MNKRRVNITESQLRKLIDTINEDFTWNQNDDGSVDVSFNPDMDRMERTNKKDSTRQFYPYGNVSANDYDYLRGRPKRGEGVMKPTVIKLNRSKLDCYALYDFNTVELNQALKHDKWGTSGGHVNWNNKNNFILKSVNYAAQLLGVLIKKLQISSPDDKLSVGYIVYPESSSDFNKNFTAKLSNKIGGQVVESLFLKNMSGIQINEELAYALGCDADDLYNLRGWIGQSEYRNKLDIIRDSIKREIGEGDTENHLKNRGVQTSIFKFWSPKYEKNAETASDANNKNFHVYQNKSKNKIASKQSTYSNINLSDGDSLNIKNTVYNILSKVQKEIVKAYGIYKDYETFANEIEQQYNKDIDKYGVALQKQDLHTKLNTDFSTNKNKLNRDSGTDKWEIKSKSEFARRVLDNLFYIDKNKIRESEEEKNTSIIIVFDDNVAGGTTMDSCCYELEKAGWKYIIPITVSAMPVTTSNQLDGIRQKERDKMASQRTGRNFNLRAHILHTERQPKYFSDTFDTKEDIHNINQISANPNYDYINKSNFTAPQRQNNREYSKRLRFGNYIITDITKVQNTDDLAKELAKNGAKGVRPATLNNLMQKIIDRRNFLASKNQNI